MLKRIQNIKNVGKFRDSHPPGQEFGINTLIFAHNTCGKSTFTAILRSLKTGVGNLVISRRSFGSTDDQKISLDFEDGGIKTSYLFQNGKWNNQNRDIHIFDTKFIAENIFDGEQISFEHQKNLNEIIIGERGKLLQKQINDLQIESDKLTAQKSAKTTEFSRSFPGADFKKLGAVENDPDIDEHIKVLDEKIKFFDEQVQFNNLVRNNVFNTDFISYETTFDKTFDAKQDAVEEHISKHWKDKFHSQQFLKEGVELLGENATNCVFCGQALLSEAQDLIKSYKELFREEYEALRNEIETTGNSFLRWDIESVLDKTITEFKQIGVTLNITETQKQEIVSAKKRFDLIVEAKQKNLNLIVNCAENPDFVLIKSEFSRILGDIKNLQASVAEPGAIDIKQLRDEKIDLENIKKRFEPEWVEFFDSSAQIEKTANELRYKRDLQRKELEEYSTTIFSEHKGTINSFCSQLGADFEIIDFVPLKKLRNQKERIFAIRFFNEHSITIDGDTEDSPSFHNTFSESDKRLLAFAFFLSILSHDQDLKNKIVVFDDPLSSFDRERKMKTIHFIADVSNGTDTPKQKIILTHEKEFYKDFKKLPELSNAQTLKISSKISDGTKQSEIEYCDIDQDFPDDDIIDRLKRVQNILANESFDQKYADDCRIILENIFKRKYYCDIKDELAQRKSVRTFSIKVFDGDPAKKTRFIRLCDSLQIELHDNTSTASDGDIKAILVEFFECLKII